MNITERLLQTARQLPIPAAQELLDFAEFLRSKHRAESEQAYEESRDRALALMSTGFDLGGRGIGERDALHER